MASKALRPVRLTAALPRKTSAAALLAKLHNKHSNGYQAFSPIRIETGPYVVKTLDTWAELWQALRLRHEVFWWEQRGVIQPFEIDVDALDLICDHLGIFENSSGELLGSYRLTSSKVR